MPRTMTPFLKKRWGFLFPEGTMGKYLIPLICLSLLVTSSPAKAETKTFIEAYTYQASEADSKLQSRAIALEQVKRLLLEKLGTYLESETEVINFHLTKDQIKIFTAGIVSTEVIEGSEKWDGKTYSFKAKITADPKEVIKSIDFFRQDRQKTKELEETRNKVNELLKEVESLKKGPALAKKDQTSIARYDEAIKELSATDCYLRGVSLIRERNYEDAIAANTRAIQLNPRYEYAYINRSYAYSSLGRFQQGLEDANKAIELNPKLALAFLNRSLANSNLGNLEQILEDSDRAIELDPQLEEAYVNRSHANYKIGNHRQAFEDASRAIELNPKLAGAYASRGDVSWILGNVEGAISDYRTAAGLGHKKAQEYLEYLDKEQARLIEGKKAKDLSQTNLRIFQAGDYINYKVTGFLNSGGVDSPVMGTAHYRVTGETQIDYYGNRCNIFRMEMTFTIMGKDRSAKVNQVLDRCITQDLNGSLRVHGEKEIGTEKSKFVKVPLSGWYYEFKCPINLHDSDSQKAIFTDGSSINETDMVLDREQMLLIGAIVPIHDRRNEATFGSPKSGQLVIGEIEPLCDRRNRATRLIWG
jgi:tetratricopeptide (TPR) repeat protein